VIFDVSWLNSSIEMKKQKPSPERDDFQKIIPCCFSP
jgi:hypothetical protein